MTMRRRALECRRLAAMLLALAALIATHTDLLAQRQKPRVPPGRDPGGVAVAIAGPTGIDYTRPEIAQRLARDGEGELIGWDFVNGDRKPYEQVSTLSARIVLAEAGATRLVPFRTATETVALGRLMVFTAKSPAKVLLLLTATNQQQDWAAFAEAAAHFKHVLTIVPIATSAGAGAYPSMLPSATMLTVADSAVRVATPGGAPDPVADLAASVTLDTRTFGDSVELPAAHVAAARIAALAARLLAVEPHLEGAALKARILSLAKPLPAPNTAATRHGWIAEPQRPFRLE